MFLAVLVPIIATIVFKQPSSEGQTTLITKDKKIITTTPDIEKSKIINAATDIKTEKNIIAGLEIDNGVDKLNSVNNTQRKKINSLQKEVEYLKKELRKEKNFTPDTVVCKIDTIYIKKKNLFSRIFGSNN